MQKRYQRGYDSLVYYFNERNKMEYARMNLYKTSLRSLAKYAQPGSNSKTVSQYNDVYKAFRNDASTYAAHLDEYRESVETHNGVFGALTRLYERQDKLTEYMKLAEQKRKTQEEQTLAKKEAFNKRENKVQQATVDKSMKRARKLSGNRMS
jgi:LPS sulfotransferase NodH